jgi:hypothetical protein
MNILTKDAEDFLDRATYSLKRAKPGSSLVVGQADDQGLMLHVKRGTDPAELVHLARSLLEQAAEWMEDDHTNVVDGAIGIHPLFGAVTVCLEQLTWEETDDDDGE